MTRATIEAAQPEDRQAVEELLTLCGLPLDGMSTHFSRFLVARRARATGEPEIVGCAGLEVYGTSCIMRSLAVRPDARAQGLGRTLVDAALDAARRAGCTEAYLLTRTIEKMAGRMGFARIGRETVPPAVRASVEFTLNACASAAAMRRAL